MIMRFVVIGEVKHAGKDLQPGHEMEIDHESPEGKILIGQLAVRGKFTEHGSNEHKAFLNPAKKKPQFEKVT